MNERIRELAEQAGLSHMPSNYPDMADLYKGADFELAKFAELIVRECIEVCADRGKQHDGLYSAWAVDCSERIGKRFGVE